MDDRVNPNPRWRSLGSIARFALAAQLLCADCGLAAAQSPGRVGTPILYGAGGDGLGRRPTIESASREAQEAIRACDDRTAIVCVADALTRYADALRGIAEERRRRLHARRTP